MACGCKNKGNNTPAPSTVQTTGNKTVSPTTNQNSIQESVKKVIEKYYNKK
jgi:DNA-binding protein Fis